MYVDYHTNLLYYVIIAYSILALCVITNIYTYLLFAMLFVYV